MKKQGDRFDPDYLADFYGSHAKQLTSIKRKYDRGDLFYCPTCIGSERWRVDDDGTGRLCRRRRHA